jgi:hypothetical protein
MAGRDVGLPGDRQHPDRDLVEQLRADFMAVDDLGCRELLG